MADDDTLPHVHPASDPMAHLALRDTRTPEERQAAEAKEYARRRGRRRKEWWKPEEPRK